MDIFSLDPIRRARLISRGADPRASFSTAVAIAAGEGNAQLLTLLIAYGAFSQEPRFAEPIDDGETHAKCPLELAVRAGHHDCVEMLIPHFLPGDRLAALDAGAWGGQLECCVLLALSIPPSPLFSQPLISACDMGHRRIADLLASRVRPSEHFPDLLAIAAWAKKDNRPGAALLASLAETKILSECSGDPAGSSLKSSARL